jgi:cell wall-associated NlpC family hydrolase
MITRARVRPIVVAPLTLLVLAGCAQGAYSVSPGTILNTVILAGEVIGSRGGSSSGTSSGSRTTTTSGSSRAPMPRSPAPSAVARRVLDDADQYVGTPYTWGGNTPRSGFDCSGFTKFLFARQGVTLPRTSREQARAGRAVPLDYGAMRAGDILLFAEPGEAVSHVAIFVGSGTIIHSSSALGGVTYTDLGGDRAEWYLQNLVAVRRLL